MLTTLIKLLFVRRLTQTFIIIIIIIIILINNFSRYL